MRGSCWHLTGRTQAHSSEAFRAATVKGPPEAFTAGALRLDRSAEASRATTFSSTSPLAPDPLRKA